MIEERCSNVTAFANNLTRNASFGFVTNSRAGFAHIMSGLVGDIVERIVYR